MATPAAVPKVSEVNTLDEGGTKSRPIAFIEEFRTPGRTFAEAAESYMTHGGSDRFIAPIVEFFGDQILSQIFPFDIKQMAIALYPSHSAATRNRQAITPARAVFSHAYERGWGPMLRIRNFKEEPPARKKAASQAWLHAFVRQADQDGLPHLAALVMFMSQTAARVSEAIELRWSEVDIINRTALLLRTKTSVNSQRMMTDQMIGRLYEMQKGAEQEDRVFRYTSRHSVNERIKAVCARAGIAYKPSHTCGRHSFANNTLALGVDVKTAMEAGGWKSPSVFLGTYVNPHNAGRLVAERLNVYQYDSDL